MTQPYPPQGHPGQQPPPPSQPPTQKRRRRWPWIVGGLFGLLVLGVAVSPPQQPPASSGTVSAPASTVYRLPTVQQPAATVAAPAGPVTSFDDGTYEVGVDIAPGKYKTPGSEFCYWGRLRHNDGSLGDIINNDLGAGPKTVTVKAGEYFDTKNCGTWTKAG